MANKLCYFRDHTIILNNHGYCKMFFKATMERIGYMKTNSLESCSMLGGSYGIKMLINIFDLR